MKTGTGLWSKKKNTTEKKNPNNDDGDEYKGTHTGHVVFGANWLAD